MRSLCFAGGFALMCGLGFAPDAIAFPVSAPTSQHTASTLLETVQVGPGYYRGHYYRKRMRHYRNNPGARYELQQRRQRFCRRSPSRC